jgi:hypothetical protein
VRCQQLAQHGVAATPRSRRMRQRIGGLVDVGRLLRTSASRLHGW